MSVSPPSHAPDKRSPPIARRRFFRPYERTPRGPRVNDRIRISPVRLLDENNEMGVIDKRSLKYVKQQGKDCDWDRVIELIFWQGACELAMLGY